VLAALDHPNIARILDGGDTPDGSPYYVMDYIEGRPLDRYCDEQQLSLTDRIKLFQQVCTAVHYLHQNLVVHRDLKPSNIQVSTGGMVKLLDFGIAKIVGAAAFANPELTTAGNSPMTPHYASPEQLAGVTLQSSSDIYSLGVILYGLLTGRSPYQGMEEKMANIASQQPPTAPSRNIREDLRTTDTAEQVRRALSGGLDNIVLKALSIDPRKRHQSAGELAQELQQYIDGEAVTARVAAAPRSSRPLLAVIAAVALVAAGGLGYWQWQRTRVADSEVATRESNLRKMLDDLEANLAPAAAARQTSEERIDGLKKLREALKSEFPSMAARQSAAESSPILERGVRYLDRLHESNKSDPRLGVEIADTYHQFGAMQEQTKTETAALTTYRKATVVLTGIGPEDPNVKRRLDNLEVRIEALEGVKPSATAPAPSDPAPAPVVEHSDAHSAPAPTPAPATAPPPQADPVSTPPPPPPVVEKKPPVAVSSGPSAEQLAAEDKFAAVSAKVQNANALVESLRQSLEKSGQMLNLETSTAARRMQSSLEAAKRHISAENWTAANESLAAADAFATRALRAVGR
jgi:Skp family chaperone for outer membrane proteins